MTGTVRVGAMVFYRSTDGGETWTNVGLKDSKTIARIIVHPTDTNTVWVAAMGDLWNPSPERGLYKTTDGGKTWKAILTAPSPYSDKVSCGDIVIDPSDPNTIYAARSSAHTLVIYFWFHLY